jgi:hypothetical protein
MGEDAQSLVCQEAQVSRQWCVYATRISLPLLQIASCRLSCSLLLLPLQPLLVPLRWRRCPVRVCG